MNVIFFKGVYFFMTDIYFYLGEDVYVMVKMSSDDVNIKMRVYSCYTKPSANAGAALTLPLIQNGGTAQTL